MNALSLHPLLPVLVVDDEAQALQSFEMALQSAGINHIVTCQDSSKIPPMLAGQEIEVLLLDLWMPNIPGEEILALMTQNYPDVPVIVVTGLNEVQTAVRCIKAGAFDYLVKPVEKSRLVTAVSRAIEVRELKRENSRLKDGLLSGELENPGAFTAIKTRSEKMKTIFKYMEAIAATSQPVLVSGETGVGKELVAKALHVLSGRQGAFVTVNVAGLDDNMFADTLFGHRKGAFTDANEARSGLIQEAEGGTLFLDEIGDLSLASQVKLLRLIQEQEYFPLGSDIAKKADARIIVATNQDLAAAMESCRFRRDLFYRLKTHRVHIPPLRERKEDIGLLVGFFLEDASRELGKKKPTAPPELPVLLGTYHFPGNVRELRGMVFDAVTSHRGGVLSMETFRAAIGQGGIAGAEAQAPDDFQHRVASTGQLPTLKEAEEMLVSEALRRAQGNQAIAARLLGLTRQALNKRLNKPQSR